MHRRCRGLVSIPRPAGELLAHARLPDVRAMQGCGGHYAAAPVPGGRDDRHVQPRVHRCVAAVAVDEPIEGLRGGALGAVLGVTGFFQSSCCQCTNSEATLHAVNTHTPTCARALTTHSHAYNPAHTLSHMYTAPRHTHTYVAMSPCPYIGGFLAVQSVPMPIYWGLFGSAKCPHAHILGAFWQCKVSPCPYIGGFLAVQSVPMPIYWGLFGSAKCPHAHILGAFWHCKVSPCPYIGGFLALQSVPMPIYRGLFGYVHGASPYTLTHVSSCFLVGQHHCSQVLSAVQCLCPHLGEQLSSTQQHNGHGAVSGPPLTPCVNPPNTPVEVLLIQRNIIGTVS